MVYIRKLFVNHFNQLDAVGSIISNKLSKRNAFKSLKSTKSHLIVILDNRQEI